MNEIPFLALDREFSENQDAYLRIVRATLADGWVLQGPQVEAVESAVARVCQRRWALAVGSCTDALFFALKAAGLGPGDDVLVTDFSFVASAAAILRTGARPVFVDIGADYHLDLDDARRRLTPSTRALLCVHLYGQMIEPVATQHFCDQHGLLLLEDAAQSFAARRKECAAGSLGLASGLSFDPTKVIAAAGSGGMVVTDDPEIASRVRRLRYHGKSPSGEIVELGFNSQMSCLSAALLLYKLKRHASWLARRRQLAAIYDQQLPEELIRPPRPRDCQGVLHKYVVACNDRDALLRHLRQAGVGCRIDFAKPLHEEALFRRYARGQVYPSATAAAGQVLSLPVHPFLTNEEAQRVVAAAKQFFTRRGHAAA